MPPRPSSKREPTQQCQQALPPCSVGVHVRARAGPRPRALPQNYASSSQQKQTCAELPRHTTRRVLGLPSAQPHKPSSNNTPKHPSSDLQKRGGGSLPCFCLGSLFRIISFSYLSQPLHYVFEVGAGFVCRRRKPFAPALPCAFSGVWGEVEKGGCACPTAVHAINFCALLVPLPAPFAPLNSRYVAACAWALACAQHLLLTHSSFFGGCNNNNFCWLFLS